jgi:hypothetical protein
LRDLVLYGEDVGEIAVVAVGPDMPASLDLDQLRGDADPVAGFAQTAFEHIANAQFAPDFFHIDRATLVDQARTAGDDEQRRIARQCGDDVLGDAIGEELLVGIGAHVLEWQHRYRGFVGSRQSPTG